MNARNKSLFTILGIFLLGFFVFSAGFFPAKAASGEWEGVGLGEGEFLTDNGVFSSIAFHPVTNEPYVAYLDNNYGYKAVVKKFDGTSWTTIGSPGFSDGSAYGISISFNPKTREPYVFYGDNSNNGRATVKKFDGASWVNVGSPGFSEGSIVSEVGMNGIAFHPETHEPYVAYFDAGIDFQAVVKKYNGSSWVNVGPAGISGEEVLFVNFAFNPSSKEPYIAYTSWDSGKATIKKFDGSSWANVGELFGENVPFIFSLAFNPQTFEPYVAYSNLNGNNKKASVKKFDGSSWVNVGTQGFSDGQALYIDLAFCPSTNEPLVVYEDDSLYYKAVAKKFDGSSWTDAGTIGRDSGEPLLFELAFNPATNEPYATYTDGIDEPESSYRIAVKKFNKLFTDTPTLAYNASKKAKKKITFNFQDLNLKIKKKDSKIRLNGRKIKLSRVTKRGNNVLMATNLKYSKWPTGNYNLVMIYKGKRGKTTYRGTWRANSVLTIE